MCEVLSVSLANHKGKKALVYYTKQLYSSLSDKESKRKREKARERETIGNEATTEQARSYRKPTSPPPCPKDNPIREMKRRKRGERKDGGITLTEGGGGGGGKKEDCGENKRVSSNMARMRRIGCVILEGKGGFLKIKKKIVIKIKKIL